MKALPFIEAIESFKETAHLEWYHTVICRLQEFYSQPLDIGMLMNPVEFPEYEAWTKGDNKFNNAMEKFLKAEDKVLFKSDSKLFYNELKYHVFVLEMRDNWTLNHFITEAVYSGIDLNWKQSIVDKYFNQTK